MSAKQRGSHPSLVTGNRETTVQLYKDYLPFQIIKEDLVAEQLERHKTVG
jgi:hypothetical protein